CVLCHREEADQHGAGHKLVQQGLSAHLGCLFFTNDLFQKAPKEEGLMGFLPADIRGTAWRAMQEDCFVCGKSGATIICSQDDCDRAFHLPCATKGGCVTQCRLPY
ncbi:PHD finger protein 7, partial [Apaloderma vittatum]